MDDYGYLTNGSFDGLMGLLQRDEVDFAATGLIIRHSRFIAVQFTAETFELKYDLHQLNKITVPN